MQEAPPLSRSDPQASAPEVRPGQAGVRRFSAIHLLIALVLLIVGSPFLEDLGQGNLVESILITLVLFFGVLVAGGTRRELVFAILLVTPAVIGKWVHHQFPYTVPAVIFRLSAVVFMVYVVAHLLRYVMRAPSVTPDVISAAISAYLLLGVIWGMGYMVTAELVPNSFVFEGAPAPTSAVTGFNAIYFSFVTLTTVGYGGIIPVSKVARMLAITEAMTGTFYVTILIARLVALYGQRRDSMREP